MRTVALSLILASMMASTALAGGGAKNANGTLIIDNDSGSEVLLLIDPSNSTLQFLVNNSTEANFRSRGGKVINIGAEAAYTLRAGTHTLYLALADEVVDVNGDVDITAFEAITVEIVKDQETVIVVDENLDGSINIDGDFDLVVAAILREATFASMGLAGLGMLGVAGYLACRKKAA